MAELRCTRRCGRPERAEDLGVGAHVDGTAAGDARPGAAVHDATESDLEGVVEIYNEVIANSTAVFANLPVTVEERRRWWQARTAQGYPVLIARDAQREPEGLEADIEPRVPVPTAAQIARRAPGGNSIATRAAE